MKTKLKFAAVVLLFLTLGLPLSTAFAQGTAFTYQGRLQNNGSPASGSYNLTFTLFNTNATGVPIAEPVTNNAVGISNGLFTVVIDFGPGAWNGETNWLEIGVETNGATPFTTLAPRQELTPTPYAIYAESVTASGISGLLTNAQLAHSAVTVDAGPGFSGGGKVGLGSTITLTNTGVLSVTGNADITATTVSGAVALEDTATNTDTPNTIVKRDGSGNFSAASITLDGTLTLPVGGTTIIYEGTGLLIYDDLNDNFFSGFVAGNTNTTGTENAASGDFALSSITSGVDDTAQGFLALNSDTVGSFNTATGAGALGSNTNANGNTADGYSALSSSVNGVANTAIGSGAMLNNTSGSYNSVLGNNALFSNTLGSNNTASGYEALYSNTGDAFGGGGNTAEGFQALYSNTLGSFNTANGYQALYSNQGDDAGNGSYNTANGGLALYYNTSGFYNTATGLKALYSNTNGSANTANGFDALYLNANGANNTADGFEALATSVGGGNTAVGAQAFAGLQDVGNAMNNNTAIGADSLANLWKGDNNTAVGWHALYGVTNGTQNIAVGYRAGQSITNGGNNIEIGNNGNPSDNNTIRIGTAGTQTNTYLAGISGVTISPAGAAVFINSAGELGTVNSSRRYKEDIQDMGDQSDVLLALRPVAFRYKHELDPAGTQQFGLIAEEVEKVAPELVLRDDQGKIYSVRYEQINAMLLNEFLKQHSDIQKELQTVEDQRAEIEILKAKAAKADSLEKRLNELETTVARIAAKSL